MPEPLPRRTTVEVSWRTIAKLIVAAALIWVWLQLYQFVLVLVVAVLLAVTLNPLVQWVERWRLPRWAAAAVMSFIAFALVGGFLWLTWSSLNAQAEYMTEHMGDLEFELLNRLPAWMHHTLDAASAGEVRTYSGPFAIKLARSVASALVVTTLASVLTVYFLIEGRRTRDWVLAFVPLRHRAKAHQTLVECEAAIFGYVAANVATSMFATVFALAMLSILHVPAALLLAVLAGVLDFVPVLGFIVAAVPALLLAATVSSSTALLVALLYLLYHAIENYVIAPRVYGDRLRLSNLAVIIGFAVGAELAGVIGALIALPVAAMYPTVERIWLREQVGEQTVREHRAIERSRV
jgi:predicted PurR-regulated permease PerM